ncbi:hypothetical protein R2538_004773 [Citrobacter freundii]|nr:hypothetical protein [Citrobacter freundii]
MNATEKDNVFYCDCGFSWRRGMSGSHNCEDGLRAKLTDMAVQLANAESKCRELAAENSAIKVMNDCLSEELRGYESDGAFEGPKMHLLWWKTETPVTEAFLAEVRAQGVTEYASKRGFSFQHGSIHAHFGNGDVMVGSVTFENGDAGINFAPVREKTGGVGTHYDWTKGKTAEQVDSIFVIASSNAEGLEVIRDKLSEAIAQLRKGAAL